MDTPIPAIDMWAPIVPAREVMAHGQDPHGSGAFLIGRQVRELLDEFRARCARR